MESFVQIVEFVSGKKYEELTVYDWYQLPYKVELTEAFMEKRKDRLDWDKLSRTQKMSYEFIQRHLDRVNLKELMHNDKLQLTEGQRESLLTMMELQRAFGP